MAYSSRGGYRPEIDGLRALAVVAVIVNHLGLLPGGFLGVDVFFVISGFVITTSLSGRDERLGSFLLGFYARRFKRLVPALIVMVLVASFAIRLFDPSPMASVVTGVTALAGASNLFLYSQAVDYFGHSVQLNPFSHTWSLGVEEQFYVLFPLLFRWRWRVPAVAALSLLSLIAFIVWHGPGAYFWTPLRFWELGVGCLLALRPAKVSAAWPLVLVLAAMLVPERFVTFSTVAAVLGAAGLIAGLQPGTKVYGLFANGLAVYVGKISYSLYLWHWVVICLARWTIGINGFTWPWLATAMFLAAAVSYHFIEEPIRHGWKAPRGVVVPVGVGALFLAATITLAGQKYAVPHFSGKAESVGIVPAYRGRYTHRLVDRCFAETFNLQACSALGPPLRLVFVGDSHATDLFPLSEVLFHDRIASVVNISQPGCTFPPLPDAPAKCRYTPPEGSVIVIRNNFSPKVADGSLARFSRVLEPFLAQAGAKGQKVVYVLPGPKFAGVGPDSLCSRQWFRPEWAISKACKAGLTEDRAEQLARRRDFVAYLKTQPVLIYDPFDALCGGPVCSPMRNGQLIYRDSTHLTEEGSELLAPSFIRFLSDSGLYKARDGATAP